MRFSIVISVLICCLLQFISPVKSQQLINNLNISASGVAVDGFNGNLYTADFEGDVSLVDGDTNQVIKKVNLGRGTSNLGFNPITNRLYVCNTLTNEVIVLDATSLNKITTILTSPYYQALSEILVDPSSNTIYVLAPYFNSLHIIDGDTNTITKTLVVGQFPHTIALDSFSNRIFIGNSSSSPIAVINRSSSEIVEYIHGFTSGIPAVDPSTGALYVADKEKGTVSQLNPKTFSVKKKIEFNGFISDLDINFHLKHLYVVTVPFTNSESELIALDLKKGLNELARFQIGDRNKIYKVAVNSGFHQAYVVDTTTKTLQQVEGQLIVATFIKDVLASPLPVDINSDLVTEAVLSSLQTKGKCELFVNNMSVSMGKYPTGCRATVTSKELQKAIPQPNQDYPIKWTFTPLRCMANSCKSSVELIETFVSNQKTNPGTSTSGGRFPAIATVSATPTTFDFSDINNTNILTDITLTDPKGAFGQCKLRLNGKIIVGDLISGKGLVRPCSSFILSSDIRSAIFSAGTYPLEWTFIPRKCKSENAPCASKKSIDIVVGGPQIMTSTSGSAGSFPRFVSISLSPDTIDFQNVHIINLITSATFNTPSGGQGLSVLSIDDTIVRDVIAASGLPSIASFIEPRDLAPIIRAPGVYEVKWTFTPKDCKSPSCTSSVSTDLTVTGTISSSSSSGSSTSSSSSSSGFTSSGGGGLVFAPSCTVNPEAYSARTLNLGTSGCTPLFDIITEAAGTAELTDNDGNVIQREYDVSPVFETIDFPNCGLCEFRLNDIPLRDALYITSTTEPGGGCTGAVIPESELPSLGITMGGFYPFSWSFIPTGCPNDNGCVAVLGGLFGISDFVETSSSSSSSGASTSSGSTSTSSSSGGTFDLENPSELFNTGIKALEDIINDLKESSKTGVLISKKIKSVIKTFNKILKDRKEDCEDALEGAIVRLDRIVELIEERACEDVSNNKCIPSEEAFLLALSLEDAIDHFDESTFIDNNENGISDICELETVTISDDVIDNRVMEVEGEFIIQFNDDVEDVELLAEEIKEQFKLEIKHIYQYAIKGISVRLSKKANENKILEKLRNLSETKRVVQNLITPLNEVEASSSTQLTRKSRNQVIDFSMQVIPRGLQWLGVDDIADRTGECRVTIATIDTGIDFTHPDLAGNINVPLSRDFTTEMSSGRDTDPRSHGTKVAGILAALDNDFGVVGIVPTAQLIALKVYEPVASLGGRHGGIYDAFLAAIDYVTNLANIIDVAVFEINFRWGQGPLSQGQQDQVDLVQDAVRGIVNAGVVCVGAADNFNHDIAVENYYPANFPEIITISAVSDDNGIMGDSDDRWALWSRNPDGTVFGASNFGQEVDIIAPNLTTTTSRVGLSMLIMGGDYGNFSGTSSATPHAAGLAALFISKFGAPPSANAQNLGVLIDIITNDRPDYYPLPPAPIDGIPEPEDGLIEPVLSAESPLLQ